MNAEAYNIIIETIAPLLETKQFRPVDGEDAYFTDGTSAVRVRYDEERAMFRLEQAAMNGETPAAEWKELSGWLFAQDAPVSDAKSIGNDFEDSLREALGVKPTVQRSTAALPARDSVGDEPGPAALAGRFLTVFPQFKGDYDRYVTEGGTFLYVHFFEEVAAPHFGALLDQNDKKRLTKLFDMLNFVYCNGDKEARSLVSAVMLAGPLRDHPDRMQTALSYMEEMPHLRTAAQFAVRVKPPKA